MVETNIMDAKNIRPYNSIFNSKRKGDRHKHSIISLKRVDDHRPKTLIK